MTVDGVERQATPWPDLGDHHPNRHPEVVAAGMESNILPRITEVQPTLILYTMAYTDG